MEHYRYYCTVKLNEVENRLQIYNCDPGDATMWYSGICDAMETFGGTVSNLMGEPVTQEKILEEFKEEEKEARVNFGPHNSVNPVDENYNNSPLRFSE